MLPRQAEVARSTHRVSWDGGGVTSTSGGDYTLGDIIGQPEAGAPLTGDGYTLIGGFWRGGVALDQHIYLPLMLRDF